MNGAEVGTLVAEALLEMVRSGVAVRVNELPVVVVPTEFVTAIGPVVALPGTVAVSEPSFATTNAALAPLNVTELVEKKFEPVNVTVVPAGPELGLNAAITGAEPGLMFVVSVFALSAGS